MKKLLKLLMPLLLLGALGLPSAAQDDETAAPKEETAAPAKPAAKPAVKKTAKKPAAKKKPAKKKKPAPPVSEYKFSAVDTVPSYKFDKRANPIVKAPKKKKAPKKAAAKTGQAAPGAGTRLKTTKPIGAEDAAQGAEGQADQPAAE
jgi:hypothetical protein